MNIDDTTNPVDGGDTSSDDDTATTETEVETEDTEQELDEDGNPIEPEEPAEEEEEIDLDDDLKLKLPKSQAEKLRQAALRQADYTRKTQELAEARKAFEAERQTYQQAGADEMNARAQLVNIDSQIARYQQVDWNAWFDADPFEAQKASHHLNALKDAKAQTQGYVAQLSEQRTIQQQQETAKRLEEGAAELAKAIPEWSPAHAAKLVEAGQKHFGFSKEDLDGIIDPKLVLALDAAVKWFEHQAKQKTAKTVQKQQEIVPAAKASSKGVAPKTTLRDDLSAEEWMRRRNAQLAKRA